MLINELSKKTGISTHTIRFYEKSGLIEGKQDESVKSNNYLHYDDVTIEKLEFISDAKSVGFAADGTLMLPDLHGDEDLLKAVRALVANEPELSSLVVKNWLAEDE